MHKLIQFIRSIYVIVLFVLLEVYAVGHYARSTHYTRAQLLSRTTRIFGLGERAASGIGRYFRLGRENRELTAYAAELQARLATYEAAERRNAPVALGADAGDTRPAKADTLRPGAADSSFRAIFTDPHYRTLTATVISNSINRDENFLILDRGTRDGVRREMAVLSAGGAIVGHVVDCSERYAVALSVLSRSFRTSGRLEGSNFFGQISWDGTDPHTVMLSDLSKYAVPETGAEVETFGSIFFPDGIRIGRVTGAQLDESGLTYTVQVELDARMAGLSHVVLIENRDLDEINRLLEGETVQSYTPHP